jgi:hypothetical protein
MTVLVVQHISTWWTKESRGAPMAAIRNAVPTHLPIPAQVSERTSSVLHEVRFAEPAFEPREELAVDADIAARLKAPCITAGCGSQGAWVSYAYARDCGGAPDRTGMRKTLVAPMGTWVQIAANGRFPAAWEGPWTYEK